MSLEINDILKKEQKKKKPFLSSSVLHPKLIVVLCFIQQYMGGVASDLQLGICKGTLEGGLTA
jgi:hypothetical protein